MEKLENLCTCTESVLTAAGRTWDDVISTTFIYLPNDESNVTRGLNLQLFGHGLIIVPDINDPVSYHMYTTKNTIDRNHIIGDLSNRGYSNIQIAKMMKCSVSVVERILNTKEDQ